MLRLSVPLLVKRQVKSHGDYIPYNRIVEQIGKQDRFRQVPFLEASKVPSMRPPLPDPRKRRLVKVDLAKLMAIKVGDRVQILYGSEKGTRGIVSRIDREKNQVIVRGANLKRSFWHPMPAPGRPSIVSVECPIHITNVVLLDPVTGEPTRVKRRYTMNGECVRVSKVSGSAMPDPVPVGPNEREELLRKHQEDWLVQAKERRGPPKHDYFGDRDYFKSLVRVARDYRQKPTGTPAALNYAE
eukprot:TRINITY_DN20271_c0_g3_i1.p2 TRINITY_DN20271_c0_g3~~TRINITY_DN20271_c0_g3_i1.p2  ORF type:complete len:242 (+),score=48.10 TRINITY_DN20271_c0_g3_i1:85-810(+)